MRWHWRCLSLAATLCVTPSVAAMGMPAPGSGTALHPLKRFKPIYPPRAAGLGRSACLMVDFSVAPDGSVKNVRLLTAYPELEKLYRFGIVEAAEDAVAHWRFRPVLEAGKPSTVPHVGQEIIFSMRGMPRPVGDTLSWLCEGRAFPVRAIRILRSPEVATSSPAIEATSPAPLWISNAGDETSQFSVAVGQEASQFLELGRTATVNTDFCVDPRGRLADLVLAGADATARSAALVAMNAVNWSAPREVKGQRVWSCGLRVRVHLFAHPKGTLLGMISRGHFQTLSGKPSQPRMISSPRFRLALHVPEGVHLPPMAKIEVRFCIDRDGRTSHREVTEAVPPNVFNREILTMVSGWHFPRRRHVMCDAYETLQFKIPSGSQ